MSKSYRVAVIGCTGCGNYGHGMDTVWLDFPECEIVAVSDPDETGRSEAMARLHTKNGYDDYRKMLKENRPDIVAIGPRWIDQHLDMCLAAAEFGCHIYMEKPFCRTLEEADKIVDACERTHIQFAIAFPTRYSPRLATVKRLVQEGAVGRVIEVQARGKEDHRGGGEDLWVLGTHIMNGLEFLFEPPQWCSAVVSVQGRPLIASDIVEGAEGIGPLGGDAIQAMYAFPDGVTGFFHSVRDAGEPRTRYGLRIHGTEGVIEMGMGSMPEVRILRSSWWSTSVGDAVWEPVTSGGIGVPEPLTDPIHQSYNGPAVRDLLEAIESKRPTQAAVYEARGTVEMIAAIYESHRLGSRVQFPLENRLNPLARMSE